LSSFGQGKRSANSIGQEKSADQD